MFKTVYLDEHLIVLDKPSGLLSVPGRGPELQDCLSARVQARHPAALVVHRLDRDTSGLIVMALSLSAQRHLSRQFEQRAAKKSYIAVVHGRLIQDSGLIDLPLRKDFDHPPCHRVDHAQGRPAQTCWQVLDRAEHTTRLLLKPITGRSHQLRIHLASLGHPILGDKLYAQPDVQAMAPRLMLHAERLSLQHPAHEAELAWQATCPF